MPQDRNIYLKHSMEILCYADHEKDKNWYNDLFFICIIKSKIWKTEISCSIFKWVLVSRSISFQPCKILLEKKPKNLMRPRLYVTFSLICFSEVLHTVEKSNNRSVPHLFFFSFLSRFGGEWHMWGICSLLKQIQLSVLQQSSWIWFCWLAHLTATSLLSPYLCEVTQTE